MKDRVVQLCGVTRWPASSFCSKDILVSFARCIDAAQSCISGVEVFCNALKSAEHAQAVHLGAPRNSMSRWKGRLVDLIA